MKKYIIGLMLLSCNGYAALVGSVILSGVVPVVVAITVTGQGVYNNLNLSTSQTNLLVVNVVEQSNDTNGYKVTLASTNSGKLVNGSNNLAYTAQYNNVTVALSSTPVTVTTQGAQSTVVNVTKGLTVSYTGVSSASMMSGTYTDTLTFTVAAN